MNYRIEKDTMGDVKVPKPSIKMKQKEVETILKLVRVSLLEIIYGFAYLKAFILILN